MLCAAKLVLMPLLYTFYSTRLGCAASPPLLDFLGALPASASVYSLTLTKQLSPEIIGPLVPATMLLTVALCLLPLSPLAQSMHAVSLLRGVIMLVGLAGVAVARSSSSARPKRS